MALTLQVVQARQCAMGLAPQKGVPGGYNVVIDYAVQAQVSGRMQDVLIGGAQQRLMTPVQTGKPVPTPAQVAALIRQDCQAVLGGQPDRVIIDGTSY